MSSATGGYLLPSTTEPIPGGLTLNQFIQTVLVGISGLAGTLVRPKWQENPPKQPGLMVNWMAFRITQMTPDTYGSLIIDDAGVSHSQRQENLTLSCAFYGPQSIEYVGIVRDGFQIPQNLQALLTANMSLVNTGNPIIVPDFVNERWVERYEMEIILRREIRRTYAILSLVSAGGTIHTDLTNEYSLDWQTPGVL